MMHGAIMGDKRHNCYMPTVTRFLISNNLFALALESTYEKGRMHRRLRLYGAWNCGK